MRQYAWILFDADETLFHFDAFSGLQLMFSRYQVSFSSHDYEHYQSINQPLWNDYQRGSISAEQLQNARFQPWAESLRVTTQDLNNAFLTAMADICQPIDGAVSLLHTLKGKAKLGIITNGFTQLQKIRLERLGLHHHFDFVVISEQVGIAKPHPDIFKHTFNLMNNPPLMDVLMVGDNLESDILGGINAGIDTCWFNPHNKSPINTINPSYHIRHLSELENAFKIAFQQTSSCF